MNAYIVTIGDELLNGNTLDTNSSWIGRELDKFNINILGKITIPDEYFDDKYYEKLKLKFKKHNIEMLDQNKEQAILLKKSKSIHNPIGTALGIEFVYNNSTVFVMPGVPKEMQAMMSEVVIPEYFLENKNNKNNITILTAGLPESVIADKINDLIIEYSREVKVAFLPKYSGVNIRLILIDQSKA